MFKKKTQQEIEQENFNKWLTEYRESIPDYLNQILLMDDLTNPNFDWYVSISNRSDGKSFGYIGFLLYFAYQSGVNFMLVCRHWTIQNAYVELIHEICEVSELLDIDKLMIKSADDYKLVIYDKKTVALITDLNNASDLKYLSALLKKFPIGVYDEFLALKKDYLRDEWEKFKTIMDSVDRNHKELPYIHSPKALLLGNAVNFDSPFIAHLNLFNKLETQPINTKRYYDKGDKKVIMEINKNDHVKKKRNSRMFGSENDPMETAQFKINSTFILNEEQLMKIKGTGKYFYIKTDDFMIKVIYNRQMNFIVLSAEVDTGQMYDYCTNTSDLKNGVQLLNEYFYDEHHYKKYAKGQFYFENTFTKNMIVDNNELNSIKIHKCIKIHDLKYKDPIPFRETTYEENKLNDIKKNIYRKFIEW